MFLELANDLVIGWDAQKFWIYKALNFYNENTVENLKNLPNNFYPYLGSLVWSFFWKISYLEFEYFGRFFYVFIYLSSILLIISNFKISIFHKVILFFLIILISYDYNYNISWSIFSGHQEIMVFSLTTISCHFLLKIFNNNQQNKMNIFCILLVCNLLIWTKHEGFVISISIISSLLFFSKLSQKNKILISLIFTGLIIIRLYVFEFYQFSENINIPHAAFSNLSFKNINEYISLIRLISIIQYFFIYCFSNYLVLIGFLIIVFYFLKKEIKKINIFLFIMLINLSFIAITYFLIDPDMDFIEHGIKTTMDRVIFQISPFIFLIMINFVNDIKKSVNL